MGKNGMTAAALMALLNGDIANYNVAATPGGIEKQEKDGQNQFCANSTLPKECPKKELEAMGIVFHDDHDDLFVEVTLPPGWEKKATDHSMWSKLINADGEEIAMIFYKAAFYDRCAFLRLS